jgi:hypothetical protein
MSISVVQHAVSGGLAGAVTLGTGLTQGNTLLYVGTVYKGGGLAAAPSSPTVGGSTISGTSTLLTQAATTGGNTTAMAIWMIPVTAGAAGATALAYSDTGNSGFAGAAAIEVVGLGTSPVLDQSASAANDNSGPLSSSATGSINRQEIIIGGGATYGQTLTITGGSAWSGTVRPSTPYAGFGWAVGSSGTWDFAGTIAAATGWVGGVVTVKNPSIMPSSTSGLVMAGLV